MTAAVRWSRRAQLVLGSAIMVLGAAEGRPLVSAMGAIHVVIAVLHTGRDAGEL